METKQIIQNIKQGKIFIYPTDTIYGIGCEATNIKSTNKIKQIKKRDKDKPLSIIVPSITWIKQNCIIPKELTISKYLPGPYTLILKKKNPNYLNHISSTDSLGIRIPKNPFTKIIQKSKLPFITTSVNISTQPPLTNPKNLNLQIKNKVDIIIDKGTLSGKPSTLIINGKEIKR
ncbi:threonylcarbamoyl-AMP synthase [archaeon]|jgi:L-threonylcarbamoyladenylate synthase|nr:threonylcarbamoyl-AMP synthase [archaeon]